MLRATLLLLTLSVGLCAGWLHLRAGAPDSCRPDADHAALAAEALRRHNTPPIALFMRSP